VEEYDIPAPDTSLKYMYTVGHVYITFNHLKRCMNLCRSGKYKISSPSPAPIYMCTVGHVYITFKP